MKDAGVAQLERTWAGKPGILGVLAANTHKTLGLRFVVTSMFFLFLAGVMAD